MIDPSLIPAVLSAPLFCAAAISDLRTTRIPGWLSLAACLIVVFAIPVLGSEEVLARLRIAAAVLCVGLALTAIGLIGRWDAAFLASAMLLVPSTELRAFALLLSGGLLLGCAVAPALRAISHAGAHRNPRRKGELPVGVSIASAGLALPFFAGSLP